MPPPRRTSLDYLQQQGVRVMAEANAGGFNHRRFRRLAVQLALHGPCPFIIYCDFDRILHWMEYHPQELRDVAQQIAHL